MTKYKFILNGLNCANCAGKIEQAVANNENTKDTNLNFTTKTIYFSHTDPDKEKTKKWLQTVIDGIENGVTVTETEDKTEEKGKPYLSIIISFVLFALGIVAEFLIAPYNNLSIAVIVVPYALSALVCGYKIFLNGIKSLFKLKIDESTLLAVAVAASFCLGEYFEACLVTLLFAIGELLEDIAVEKSRKNIESLAEIRPDTAWLLINGKTEKVPAETVKISSVIEVKPFERVPLDGTVTEGNSNIDASALTGESMPLEAHTGTQVLSGMINGEGLLLISVTKTYETSAASRIINMVEESSAAKGSSEKLITRFARIYTPVVIGLAVLLTFIPPLCGFGEITVWLSRALVFLVASCPCAMVISVPLAFYAGIGKASRNGVLIKGGRYLEALGKADTFIFDKTGTLTTGKLKLESVESFNGYTNDEVLAIAAACEKNSVHPAAAAIKKAAASFKKPTLTAYREIAGTGVEAYIDNKRVLCGSYRVLDDENADKNAIYLTIDKIKTAKFTMSDALREETPEVIGALKNMGAKSLVMLTGDNEKAAQKTSDECGLTGCYAGLLPEDKVELAKKLKAASTKSVYVGDGINDAPVLAVSDCGLAMGLGSDIAIESADGVLSAGNLVKLPFAVMLARRVLTKVRENIIFALLVKAAVLVLAAIGIAPMWLAVMADTGVSLICVINAASLNIKQK